MKSVSTVAHRLMNVNAEVAVEAAVEGPAVGRVVESATAAAGVAAAVVTVAVVETTEEMMTPGAATLAIARRSRAVEGPAEAEAAGVWEA